MTRTNPPDVEALLAQLAANATEIAALKARVSTLEEELRLAQQHRFGPRSEKHMDRLFNEAEQAAGSAPDIDSDFDAGIAGLDTVGLPDDRKACPCCQRQMHRMGEAVTEQLHIEVKAKVLQSSAPNTRSFRQPLTEGCAEGIWPTQDAL